MSRQFRTSLLALASVAIPIAVPMSASANLSTPRSTADVLYVDSVAFPEGQTGVSATPGMFSVVAATKDAKRLKIKLDGKSLADRGFGPYGLRARTEFGVAPAAGWHRLELTVIDAQGNRSGTRAYSFGVRQAASADAKSVAASGTVVGGRFVEADGSPAVHLPVTVYPVRMDRGSGPITPIAKTTTGADGMWTVSLRDVPAEVRRWAAANDGVLNLDAIAEGAANDPKSGAVREMSAVSGFTTGLPTAGTLTEAASKRLVGNLHRACSELDGAPNGTPTNVITALTDMVAYNNGKPLTSHA
jgi:hypothetical protein